ncbi:MAG: hypothetical protein SynsKO_37590 [Synoicihabitans sp.]
MGRLSVMPVIRAAVLLAGICLASTLHAMDPATWAEWRERDRPSADAWLRSAEGPGKGQDAVAEAEFLYAVTVEFEKRGEYQMELEVARLALDAASRTQDPAVIAKAQYAMGLGHWGVGDLPAAVAVYSDVLEWFSNAGVWEFAGRTASNLGGVFHDSGELVLAVEYYQRGIDYLRKAGSPPERLGDALGNLALLWYHLGDAEKSDRLEREALALRRENNDLRGMAISLNNLGDRAIRAGRNDEAAVHLNESFALIQRLEDKSMLAGALTLQAQLDITRDDEAAARAKLRASQDIYEETGAKVEHALFHASFAEALARQSGYDDWALEILETHLPTLRAAGRSETLDNFLGIQISLLRRMGDAEKAWEAYTARETFRAQHSEERMRERSQYLDTVFQVARKDRALKTETIARSEAETTALKARHDRNLALALSGTFVVALVLLAWRFISVRKANRLISQQRDELATLNADKDTFMRIASHDLKSPLAGIRLSLGFLRQDAQNEFKAETKQMLADAENTAARSLEMVSAFLDDQLRRSPQSPPDVSLPEMLNRATAEVLPLARSKSQRIEIDIAPTLNRWQLDQPKVERMLANLLTNAIQAAPDSTDITISIQQTDTRLKFSITNSASVEEDARSSSPVQLPHHGHGLTLVRELTAQTGGEFTFHLDQSSQRAIATLMLP